MIYPKLSPVWVVTTVMDLADRKVIGWAFSNTMTAKENSVKAWKIAIKCRGVKPGVIFHSDNGKQDACDKFK